MDQGQIAIVSGLPRSGTSMLMKMLEAGGIQVLTDNIREADKDNPKGYYEFEKVKQIDRDKSWLEDAKGKVVKMVSQLLQHLPPDYNYKVVFIRRRMDEILASQHKMLIRRGEPSDKISDEQMAALFRKHLKRLKTWLDEQPNFEVIYVSYNKVLVNPVEQARRVSQFFDGALNVESMVNVVDPTLYRQRK